MSLPMSLRSRLSITTAAALLAAAAAVTPAVADDEWDASGASSMSADTLGSDTTDAGTMGGDGYHRHDDRRFYRGVVTANTLALRSAPNRGSRIIRFAHRGDKVKIFCKAPGQTVQGNPLWYLLADGTWAWGAARFIDNIGPAPRWC
ncbi:MULTISPECIES: SH3 domain-containing protein [Streptomyces]|uniref:SH3 domain-containing protein n=1 Tax=Streptomyces koelreuteriae TaxID=2838015 RepID=A0ABX8FPM1_9ACTN|nr:MULTISPECIES: SH3 domain-containing protein [Streptomyces]QWB23093.1 SH3 domain-containing protein [Streptomyces koelreuteriae]UUA06043.1 SH3 domain-containing protein [Streptomyces koelreuteriae]UUA13671.1 SH3 domain-containing protein [Streptomyces sp. CRCS-T-1]